MIVVGAEPVLIGPDPATGWFDPAEHLLYLEPGPTVPVGTLITFRGLIRRVIQVETWNEGGLVLHLEPGPVYFPDQAKITRHTQGPFDPVTDTYPEIITELWDGPALVEVAASASAMDEELVDRRRELILYVVKVPLEVVDLEQHDQIEITISRDPRLVGRTVHVIRVLGESHAQERVVHCAERQV